MLCSDEFGFTLLKGLVIDLRYGNSKSTISYNKIKSCAPFFDSKLSTYPDS